MITHVLEKRRPFFLRIEQKMDVDGPETLPAIPSDSEDGSAYSDVDENEVETYEEAPREWYYTTRSGRRIFSVQRLIVPMPHNEKDSEELKAYDDENGSDNYEGLSDRSIESSSSDEDTEDEEEGESENEEF